MEDLQKEVADKGGPVTVEVEDSHEDTCGGQGSQLMISSFLVVWRLVWAISW